ncbi:MAG: UDP-N-acetylmuramoyl-L-alanyl-D-glutamate--2,6-diaminopimelate ligase [bacterium]|nr:UDP-N-acetylmuramoyl-L-alanyl-D-glutamate--2,6-diaminopimelate ligase [bacterium]
MFLSWYHFFWSFLGALFFGFPSEKIFVLGVTGTKGKSTVLELINAILEAAGKKTALLSSVRIKINKQNQKNYLGNTMPGRAFIQSFLKQAVSAGCEYALVEVTSQGITQHRHRFIKWDAALFTNLAPEHIESHGSFEKYREAKISFFAYVKKLKISQKLFFINKDDATADYFIKASEGGSGQVILYSKNNLQPTTYNPQPNLIGDFNLENIAAAIAFAKSQGIGEETIKKALENFHGVPGRMEIIQTEPFIVVIDYAHTPDSLEKVYQTINSKFKSQNSKLICVLGSAGGGRDKWKRPKMGEIAAKYCDEIVLTNEDSYDESPLEIINQIEEGIGINQHKSAVYKILDRREAIKKALVLAKKGDTVILTGKGCEPWLHLEKGKKIPWDERKIVEEIIKETKILTD